MTFATADLCDEHRYDVRTICEEWRSYGGVESFCGEVVTVELDESNPALVELLRDTEGRGRVVVVDVAKAYYAVVGDNLMKFAHNNGWAGIVINGYVRDTKITKTIPVGLKAIGTSPRKSFKKSQAHIGEELHFGDTTIKSGDYLYADEDGVVVASSQIEL